MFFEEETVSLGKRSTNEIRRQDKIIVFYSLKDLLWNKPKYWKWWNSWCLESKGKNMLLWLLACFQISSDDWSDWKQTLPCFINGDEDADCDGVISLYDCDDTDPNFLGIVMDQDCDGYLTGEDCDDSDSSLLGVVVDQDCDGVLTENDCNDDKDTANDMDCDGALTTVDCDDTNPNLFSIVGDQDCDGILTEEDCDDDDEYSTIVAEDGDCDGFLTEDDCDDTDPNLISITEDSDCDGYVTAEDCDDTDPDFLGFIVDGDCDGVLAADDCDDTDPSDSLYLNDCDQDGVLGEEDCNDTDPSDSLFVDDCDQDGVLTEEDCDDDDEYSTIVAEDGDCDGFLTEDDCDDNDSSIHPNAVEIANDGIDQDCDDIDLITVSRTTTPSCPSYSSETYGFSCSGGIVMEICGDVDSNGDLTIKVQKDTSTTSSATFSAGTYSVRVFDSSEPISDQCKYFNDEETSLNVTNSNQTTLVFPSFDPDIMIEESTSYCVTKADGGSDAHWCSGKLVLTYQ